MKIYVDMDGVIADFFGGLERKFKALHWKDIYDVDSRVEELRHTDFFFSLHKFETSDALISFVRTLSNGNWGICSSPIKNDFANSTYHKRRWLDKNGYMPFASNLVFTHRKEKYAVSRLDGEPNILIDDKPSNIKAWEEKGGIGIRYQANEDDLEEYLFARLEEVYK